jgi:hypothetical protein
VAADKVEVVRAIYEAWGAGRSARAFMTPDIEYVNPPDAVEPGIRRGPKAFAGIRSSYDDIEVRPQQFIDAPGDDVVVIARITGRGHVSGLPVDWVQGYVWTVSDGLATRFCWFNRPEDALAAAGVERD